MDEDISIEGAGEKYGKSLDLQLKPNLDRSKPDGTPRKLMDTSRLRDMNWKPKISLIEGISSFHQYFVKEAKRAF